MYGPLIVPKADAGFLSIERPHILIYNTRLIIRLIVIELPIMGCI